MKDSRRIVFINQDSGYLTTDLINAFAARGYNCVLIAGRLNMRNTPLDPATKIDKIIQYDRSSSFSRLWTWIIAFVQIWFKIVFKYRGYNLFIVSNPPLAPLLPLLVRNRYRLLIFDVFPDALSELGYLSEKSIFIKWWKNANRKSYRKADAIFTISESMKQLLLNYSDGRPINVVPVWTDNTFLQPVLPEENPFLKKHNLVGKFVVLYSGNIGLSGDVDVMLDLAAGIDRDDIVFLIIGEGAKKKKLTEDVEKRDLKNVVLLPWQPGSELPYSLSSASLAVVSLGVNASQLAIPSKLYNYLSVGSPLLCICAAGSEVEKLVLKYECGRSFEPDKISEMMSYIVEVADNSALLSSLRQRSFKASKNFDVTNVEKFFEVQ